MCFLLFVYLFGTSGLRVNVVIRFSALPASCLQASYKAGTSWCTAFECVWVNVCEGDRQGLTMVSRRWACDLSVLFAQFETSIQTTYTLPHFGITDQTHPTSLLYTSVWHCGRATSAQSHHPTFKCKHA